MVRNGQDISPAEVTSSAQMLDTDLNLSPSDVLSQAILTARGKSIRPKTLGQKQYVDAIDQNTIVFGIGPAGTGKTYLAMAKAVQALQRKEVSRIILTRPAVEAGERLGYLPGTLTDKIDPYLRPLYDALNEMMDPELVPKLLAAGTIEVAPLAYMRGRTLNDSFIVLDEAQNTTPEQMKMFLTRLGFGFADGRHRRHHPGRPADGGERPPARDPRAQRHRRHPLRPLTSDDVVRHTLVGRIVDAYTEYDAQKQALHYEREQAAEFANRAERRSGIPRDRLPKRTIRASREHRGQQRVGASRSTRPPCSGSPAYALDIMHVHPDAELAIVLVDEAAMEQLHVQWMDEPGPTDVLSFPMDELRPGTEEEPTPAGLLGDVVLCPQVAQAQAETAGHSPDGRAAAAHDARHPAPARLRSRGAGRGEGDVRHPARHPRRLRPLRPTALGARMLATLFFIVAFLLVAFGGLMAAVDAALSVQSRADIAELAETSRSRSSRCWRSPPTRARTSTRSTSCRIIAETTAAVLVTLGFEQIFEQWWVDPAPRPR